MTAFTTTEAADMSRSALASARGWIGTPYRHQGSRRGVACDCLGLIRGVWREIYGEEPELPGPYAPDWAEASGEERLLQAARRHLVEKPLSQARPGDVVLFRWRPHLPAKHAAILDEDGGFIHAYEGMAVLRSMLVPQWRRRVAAAFGFPATAARTSDTGSR